MTDADLDAARIAMNELTAEVVLLGARRQRAIRIQNSALGFRPPPDVLQAIGESDSSAMDAGTAASDSGTDARRVWEYDGTRFTPIAVRLGLADDQWTEPLGGSIRPGDALVTSAVVRQRSRM